MKAGLLGSPGQSLWRAPEPCAIAQLQAVTIGAFLAMEIPPRGMVLAPIIPDQGLVMLYAMRGVGKTHVVIVKEGGDCRLGGKFVDGVWKGDLYSNGCPEAENPTAVEVVRSELLRIVTEQISRFG